MLSLVLMEMLPFNSDNVPPPVFYSYKLIKVALFVVLGFETPLTFWRFDSIRVGILLSLISELTVECLQNMSSGHTFSIVELLAKGALIMVGFILAFNPRHDHELSMLGIHINLIPNQKM